ncbi:MAG: glutamate-5-semialdehyde dehydrogenase [Candidatus Omnitrophica bacterium]|nr:glutamate-5-semialdehyde dehydrogenase [Candidatus Omnitrophota bacterium]
MNILDLAKKAKDAKRPLANLTSRVKNRALRQMANGLKNHQDFILKENKKDIRQAKALSKSSAFIDRLTLNEKRINEMSRSLKALVDLADPVGDIIKEWQAPPGFNVSKVRIPLGVILVIYESRPDVTSDCIGLCLKSGNCVILRGGSEAIHSNKAIYKVLTSDLVSSGIAGGAINLVTQTEHLIVRQLLKLDHYIDLVIPRGGKSLIHQISRLSRIPVIKHYEGICYIYVDKDADLKMAQNICFNAKVQRPGTCNAMEAMLVHREIAPIFLPKMIKRFQEAGVEIRGCKRTLRFVKGITPAKERDYRCEYLDLILATKVVKNLEEAIKHINNYGSHHSDGIITNNSKAAADFLKSVDSACVYQNVSTRFTDGYQFGLGPEMGISTDRLHCRGPMTLEDLTTYKYVVRGKGQIRL